VNTAKTPQRGSPVSTLTFDALFGDDSDDEASAPTTTLFRATTRARAAVQPAAAAAYARQLAALQQGSALEVKLADATAAFLASPAAVAAAAVPDGGAEATRLLARALRATGFSAVAVVAADHVGAAGGTTPRAAGSPTADARTSLLQRAARHAFVAVDPPAGASTRFSEVLVVEPRLREQFELPRPDAVYGAVLAALPTTFVGSEARLAALVRWMAARARDSFAAADMATPPWRAEGPLLAKWRLHERADAGDDDVHQAVLLPLTTGRPAQAVRMVQRNGVPFLAHVAACTPPHAGG
jgi:uncharacterized protein (TIGR01615 family)